MSRAEHSQAPAPKADDLSATSIAAGGDAPLFSLRGLSFAYAEDSSAARAARSSSTFRLAIDELDIRPGERLAIVGHNGSGKTSLLRILAGLETATTSAPIIRPPSGPVGFLKQDPYLFQESSAKNLAFPLRVRRIPATEIRARVAAMLEMIGLADAADHPAAQLSGGERKRLALGRVLIAEPEVLLLDEPDAYLDRHSQAIVERTLLARAGSLILTTHDLRFAHRVAARILHLREGRVTAGLPANVIAGAAHGSSMTTPGGLVIHFDREVPPGTLKVALDPRSLVISRAPLDSSMRNHFRGRIASVHDQAGSIWIDLALEGGQRPQASAALASNRAASPATGDALTAIISRESYEHLGLNLNHEVIVSFKAHAVEIL